MAGKASRRGSGASKKGRPEDGRASAPARAVASEATEARDDETRPPPAALAAAAAATSAKAKRANAAKAAAAPEAPDARHADGPRRPPRFELSIPRAVWIIMALGAAIRLFGAFRWGLWLDEIYIHQIINGPVAKILGNAHAVHFLAAWPFVALADHQQLALRAPSLIFGVLSIPLGFIVARRLFDERAGTTFSLFIAFGTYFITYSVDANYYSHMMFWTLAGFYFYALGWSLRNPLYFLPIIPIAGLTFFVHPFSAVFFAILFSYLLLDLVVHGAYFQRRPALAVLLNTLPRRAVAALGLVVGVGLSAWIVAVAGGWGAELAGLAETFTGMIELGKTPTNVEFSYAYIASYFLRFGPAFLTDENDGTGSYALINHALFALFLLGAALSARRNRALPVLFLIPFLASFGLLFNLDAKRAFSIRYFSYLAPIYWLGIAAAVSWAAGAAVARCPALRRRAWAAGSAPALAIGAALLAFSAPQYWQMLTMDAGNWNKVMAVVAPRVAPGEPFVCTNSPEEAIVPYYLEEYGLKTNPRTKLCFNEERDKFTEAELKDLCYSTPSLWFVMTWTNPQSKNALAWARERMETVVEAPNIFMSMNRAEIYHWDMGGRYILPPRIFQYSPPGGADRAPGSVFEERFLFDQAMDYEIRVSCPGANPAALTLKIDDAPVSVQSWSSGDFIGVSARARVEAGIHRLTLTLAGGALDVRRIVVVPRYPEGKIVIPAHAACDIYPSMYTLTPKIDGEYVLKLVRNTFASYKVGLAEGGLYRIRLEARHNGAAEKVDPVWLEVRVDGRLAGLLEFDNSGASWATKSFPYPVSPGDHKLVVSFVNERKLSKVSPETDRDALVRSIELEMSKPNDAAADDRVFTSLTPPVLVPLPPDGKKERAWGMTTTDPVDTKLATTGGYENEPLFIASVPRDSAGLLLTSPVLKTPPSGLIYHSSMARAQNLMNHSINVRTTLLDAQGQELGALLANEEGITGETDWVRFVQVKKVPPVVAAYQIVLWVYPNGHRPSEEPGGVMFSQPQLENVR